MADLMFRPGTWDEAIWKNVVHHDEYKVKGLRFVEDDAVLDIGGHVGSFAYLCLDRGAGRTVSVEPDPENFTVMRHNLHTACRAYDRAVLIPAACGRSDQPARTVGYERCTVPENTGGGGTFGGSFKVALLQFDALVSMTATFSERDRVRMVKLDCEGSEWPALQTSVLLGQVDSIVGEYHCRSIDGQGDCGPDQLARILAREDFKFHIGQVHGHVGLFWAWRPGYEFPGVG